MEFNYLFTQFSFSIYLVCAVYSNHWMVLPCNLWSLSLTPKSQLWLWKVANILEIHQLCHDHIKLHFPRAFQTFSSCFLFEVAPQGVPACNRRWWVATQLSVKRADCVVRQKGGVVNMWRQTDLSPVRMGHPGHLRSRPPLPPWSKPNGLANKWDPNYKMAWLASWELSNSLCVCVSWHSQCRDCGISDCGDVFHHIPHTLEYSHQTSRASGLESHF